jgi:hypothetical protein
MWIVLDQLACGAGIAAFCRQVFILFLPTFRNVSDGFAGLKSVSRYRMISDAGSQDCICGISNVLNPIPMLYDKVVPGSDFSVPFQFKSIFFRTPSLIARNLTMVPPVTGAAPSARKAAPFCIKHSPG